MQRISMRSRDLLYVTLMLLATTAAGTADAQRREGEHGGMPPMGHQMMAEPMRAPQGYAPIMRPPETANRPQTMDRDAYRHNFTAPQAYRIGPYHPPHGYAYRRYAYGQILPRLYWSPDYILSDYWLFGLDLPPVGFEWVRYGPDALLIDMTTGEVVQTVYAIFP
ncbi:MAG: RcnB family protein [Candidatus Sphingomonas colombiensis]|nr:RcnB family protein [Sphingomonas sp.]WEK42592.1 MAG: RcnB family protein [Sphingomonas sp.]